MSACGVPSAKNTQEMTQGLPSDEGHCGLVALGEALERALGVILGFNLC